MTIPDCDANARCVRHVRMFKNAARVRRRLLSACDYRW
jgi:small basic protein